MNTYYYVYFWDYSGKHWSMLSRVEWLKKINNARMYAFPGDFVFSSFFWANTYVGWMYLQLCYWINTLPSADHFLLSEIGATNQAKII